MDQNLSSPQSSSTPNTPNDYILSLYEVCELLNKSARTVSRYVHRNILHPIGVKSRQGTLEYRFSRAEVDELKRRELARFAFPQLGDIMPTNASFASMNYPVSPTVPRTPYTMPGIAYAPISTNDNQPPLEESQSNNELSSKPLPTSDNKSDNFLPNHNELPETTTNKDDNNDNEAIIKLLKETTEMLRDQLRVKDNQIKSLDEKIGQLIERNRETNILLKGLQDKMVCLKSLNLKTILFQTELLNRSRWKTLCQLLLQILLI